MAILKKLLVVAFFLLILPRLASNCYAADYQVHYDAFYKLQENGNANVELKIVIKNATPVVYVKEFQLSFPALFKITNIQARDDAGKIVAHTEYDSVQTKLRLRFTSPQTGKNTQNTFYLTFTQNQVLEKIGSVWEVMIPVISGTRESYKLTVSVPISDQKIISIVKPAPDSVVNNTLFWNNVSASSVYFLVGTSQTYHTQLSYALDNKSLKKTIATVAFPPETAFQKVIVQDINPKPEKTFIDDDGNFIGEYELLPREKKHVQFSGFVQVMAHPQNDYIPFAENVYKKKPQALLKSTKYWEVNSSEIKNLRKKLTTIDDIYQFVVATLSYNPDRVNKNSKRLGASQALLNPQAAICMEYTDLFISLSRGAGIASRELHGYAYSTSPQLKPLSLQTDVLHAWPEYYSPNEKLWKQVDPTWQDTSGTDYFTTLDLNHIVFAIHGTDDTYPLSAGMYKTVDSKDVFVEPVTNPIQEIENISVNEFIPNTIISGRKYTSELEITNRGNTFLKNATVELVSSSILLTPRKVTLDLLAPGQITKIPLVVVPKYISNKVSSTVLIRLNNRVIFTEGAVIKPHSLSNLQIAAFIFFLLMLIFAVMKFKTLRW